MYIFGHMVWKMCQLQNPERAERRWITKLKTYVPSDRNEVGLTFWHRFSRLSWISAK